MDKTPLLGTWRLKAHVVTTTAGERSTPYGESPIGYLSYSVDGRMQVIGAAHSRRVPADATPTDYERALLYDTMFAYAVTHSIEAGRAIHHVDISWNEIWTGTDQIRLFEVTGNTLTLTTRIADPASGVERHYSVMWEVLGAINRDFALVVKTSNTGPALRGQGTVTRRGQGKGGKGLRMRGSPR